MRKLATIVVDEVRDALPATRFFQRVFHIATALRRESGIRPGPAAGAAKA